VTSTANSIFPRPRRVRALLYKLTATIILLGLISLFLKPERVWKLFSDVQPLSLLIVIGLSVVGLAIQWTKWQLLLGSVRPQTTIGESLASLLVGFTLGMVSPGRIGEVARGIILPADSRASSLGAASADRLCSAAITISLGLAAFVFLRPAPGALVAFAMGSILLIGLRLTSWQGTQGLRNYGFFRTRVGVFVMEALEAMVQVPRRVWVKSLGLSLIFQLLLCTQFYILATDWLALRTELWLGIPIIFAVKALLPIAFLDLGVREAAAVLVFSRLNFDPAVGFNCAVLLYGINVILPAVAGALIWSLRGRHEPLAVKIPSVAGKTLALSIALTFATGSELQAQNTNTASNALADSTLVDSQISPTPPMVRFVAEGDFLAQRGEIEAAVKKYEEARAIGAGSAYLLNRLAQLYLMSSRPLDAIALLQQSLNESRDQLAVYSMLGESFLAIGQPDSALHYVNEAKDLAPDVSSIRSYLGLLYLQSGRTVEAKTQLDAAMSLDVMNGEAHRFLGLYYTQLDSLNRAVGYYERVIELQPSDMEAHNNIAFLHSQLRHYEKSLDYYQRTKKLTSDPNILHSININMQAVRAMKDGKLRARYILVDTEAQGRDVLMRLQRGGKFAALATQFSKAPNAPEGGDMGYFDPGDMVADVEAAVLGLELGAVSDLIRIQQGIMILQRLN